MFPDGSHPPFAESIGTSRLHIGDALRRSRVNGRKKTRTCARSARRRTHLRPRIPGTRTLRRSYDSSIAIIHGPLSRTATISTSALFVSGTRFADVIKIDSSATGKDGGSLSGAEASDDGRWSHPTSGCRTNQTRGSRFRRRGPIYFRE